MQRLVTLIIVCAVIYLVFEQSIKSLPDSSNKQEVKKTKEVGATTEIEGSFIEKTLSNVLLNLLKTDEGKLFLETLVQPMNNPINGSSFEMNSNNFVNSLFKISTFGDGNKGPASCGHIVTIEYKILSMNDNLLEENVATFPLGSGKIAPGIDTVVVGMKAGQTRIATISNKYFNNDPKYKDTSFKVRILLKEILPANYIDDTVKIFDNQLSYKFPLLCGAEATYDTKITELSNGKVIYNSLDTGKKIKMRIGNLNYPIIFSHSLHNKIPVGTRTVIARGKFFKSFSSKYSSIFPNRILPEDEYFMVEFFNLNQPQSNMN